MAINYFVSKDENLSILYKKLILWFKERDYVVDAVENDNEYLIQAKKTGTFRTLTGTNQAFKIKICWSHNSENDNEFILETNIGQWVSNLAGAGITAIVTGGFTALTVLTSLAGAGWALIVEDNIIEYVENTLHYQKIKQEVNTSIEQLNNSTHINVVQSQNNELVNLSANSPREKAEQKVNQAIDKLEQAYREGILEKEEFEFKKSNLEAQIENHEIDFIVEEKIIKLEQAFVQGILNEEEYESKVSKVRSTIEEEMTQRKLEEKNLSRMIKLKQALESGVLTQAEYKAKVEGFQTSIL